MSIKITEQNFETEVLQSAMPVVVGFLGRLVRPLQDDGPRAAICRGAPTVKVGKLNTDENLKRAMAPQDRRHPGAVASGTVRRSAGPSVIARRRAGGGCGERGDLIYGFVLLTKKEPKKFHKETKALLSESDSSAFLAMALSGSFGTSRSSALSIAVGRHAPMPPKVRAAACLTGCRVSARRGQDLPTTQRSRVFCRGGMSDAPRVYGNRAFTGSHRVGMPGPYRAALGQMLPVLGKA